MYAGLVKSLRICEGACNKGCVLYNSVSIDGDTCQKRISGMAADAIEKLISEVEKYRHAAFIIGETCVDASKQHLTPEAALQKIRENIYYSRLEEDGV